MRPRVLVVDDDLRVAGLLTTMLSSHGCEVRTASDVESALSSALGWCPSIILIDLEMPSTDGLDLCRRVQATSSAAMVLVFGSNDRRSEAAALDAGADDYIGELFASARLLARLRVALRGRQRATGSRALRGDASHRHPRA